MTRTTIRCGVLLAMVASAADGMVHDRATGGDDRVEGSFKVIRGPVGHAVMFDKYNAQCTW